MALTKAKLIADGVIVAANLHSSHGITSANIGENTNLYFTNARARSAISVSGNALSYNSSTGVITSNFEESPTFTGTVTVSGDLLNISGATPELKLTDSDDSNYALYSYTDGDLLISTNHGNESGAADIIRFANNGATERMRIHADGNVTIGNTTSVQPLTVAGNVLFRTTTADSFENRFQFIVGGSGDAGNFYVYNADETATVRLNGNGASYINGGAFLIGQTSTVSTHLLTVNGKIGGPTFSDSYLQFTGGNVLLKANDDIKLGYNQNVIVKQSGNVGIGLTSPAVKLEIQDSTHTTMKIRSGNNDNILFAQAIQSDEARIGTDTNSAISFFTNTGRRMTITTSGLVGIGTNLPDGNLEVITSTTVSGASDSVNNVLIGLQAANRPTIILDTADTTYTNRTWNITNVGSAGSLFFGRNGLDVLVMKNDGKVGIGTTSPAQKLDVVGSSGDTNIRVYDASANSEVGIKLQGDAKTWTLQNWGSGGDNLRLLNNAGNIVQLWDDNGNIAIGNFNDPDRTLDVRGTGMSIYGTGDYTELMLRGQVEGTGTVRNVGSWHWSIRGDIGGDNDDLKLVRFVTGSYVGIAMQVQNSTGDIFFGNTVVNPASGFSNQRGLGYDNSTGNLQVASTSGTAMTIGRNESSDGQILQLRKESTIKHSFGSTTSYFLGNVGIDVTSPGVKLDVSGNIRLQGGNRKIIFNNTSVECSLDQMSGAVGGLGTLARFGVGTVSPNNTFQLLGNMTIGSGTVNETPRYIQTGGTLVLQGADANHRIIIRGTQNTTGTVTGNSNNMDFYEYGGYNFYSGVNISNGTRNLALAIASDGDVGIGLTSPVAKLHIHGTGDLIRATSNNTGQGGAQMDLIHHTTSPANNDIHGLINFGGYYSGTSQSYGSSIRSVWTDVGNQHGQLQFYTRDGSDFDERAKIDMHGHASRSKHSSNSSADVVNTTFTGELTTFQGHGKKYLGMFVIRDGSRYLDVAINSTANNVMYYIYVIGYLYNRGTYVGVTSGYTYTNNSIINHNSGDILDLGVAKSIVSYRGTNSTAGNYTGYLCFRFDSGGNGYSEGQLQVYISSHSLSWQKFADVHAVVQNDTTNNYFAQ